MEDGLYAKRLILTKLEEYAKELMSSGDIAMFAGIMKAIEKIEDIEV